MNDLESMERREFLRNAALGFVGAACLSGPAAAAASGPLSAAARPVSPNEKIGLGFIGVGGRGRHLLRVFQGFPDVEVVALCDVRKDPLDEASKLAGGEAERCGDYRKLLERKDVRAVVVATNGHWHPLPAYHACKAGKDVYLEKPVSITPGEGRKVVEAARTHGRIVAMGTQQRSMAHYPKAVEYIRSGKLGKVAMVETLNFEHSTPERFGNPLDSDPPPGIDWDFWLGPAPRVPYNPARIAGHYFFWDTAGGWQSDWAVHHNDIVHWAMDVTGPLSVAASGGRYFVKDCTEMPDTMECLYEYPGFLLAYKLRWSNRRPLDGLNYGDIFYGTQGTLVLNRSGWKVFPEGESKSADECPGEREDGPHQRDFLDCLRTRKKPAADIETGHTSSIPGEIANIAYRLGRKLRWDAAKEEFPGDAEANRMLLKEYRAPWKFD